jgi:RHS repeat-associated protein
MLDVFGLIHMNGRVYDPQIGRFLQADVLLDAGIQGLNRYSYVLNNPLSLTDPSGHVSVGQILRTVAAIAITVYTGGAAAGLLAENLVGQALAVAMAPACHWRRSAGRTRRTFGATSSTRTSARSSCRSRCCVVLSVFWRSPARPSPLRMPSTRTAGSIST